jgi:hypothetical protein
LALRYERGAAHYGDRNWERGQPVSRVMDSAIRHACDYMAGNRAEDHLAAAAWNLFAAIHYEEEAKAGRLPASLIDVQEVPQ